MNSYLALLGCLILPLLGETQAYGGIRIKDITDIQGARHNQLVGIGLVTGLENTGGRSTFTQKVAVDMLQRFKINTKIANTDRLDNVYRSGNVSVVTVTADLGPYARVGSRIDVTVSVMDDASSLHGGVLIFTPLKGADGVDYALAAGPLTVGGFLFNNFGGGAPGNALSTTQKNHPTVGRLPGGATVEREARGNILCNGSIRLLIRDPDFTTARHIARVVNAKFPGTAYALDAGTVEIMVPPRYEHYLVRFISEIGHLEVEPDAPARVVINERTGTIVAGKNVKVSRVAVAHRNLTITTINDPFVSQPLPFSRGVTVPGVQGAVDVALQGKNHFKVLEESQTVSQLAQALSSLGVEPRDMIAVFDMIKRAGSLHADLIIQ